MDRVRSIPSEEWLDVLVWTAGEMRGTDRDVLGSFVDREGDAFWRRNWPVAEAPIA